MSNHTCNSIPSERSCGKSRNYPSATEVLPLKAGASVPEESALLDILWATRGNHVGEH